MALHGHERLKEFGALSGRPRAAILDWIGQLADAGLIRREGEYGVLKVPVPAARVLRGKAEAALFGSTPRPPRATRKRTPRIPKEVSEPAGELDRPLFEHLRALRRAIADERHLPAFMIQSDSTLRALARLRPASSEDLLRARASVPSRPRRTVHAFWMRFARRRHVTNRNRGWVNS